MMGIVRNGLAVLLSAALVSSGIVYAPAAAAAESDGQESAQGNSLALQAESYDVTEDSVTFQYQGSSETAVYYSTLSSTEVCVGRQSESGVDFAVDTDYAGALTIPETVTYDGTTYTVVSVSAYAFSSSAKNVTSHAAVVQAEGVEGLTSISLPATVEQIGESAFARCSGLTEVTLRGSSALTEIGAYAFGRTSSLHTALESFTVPEGVTRIGGYAFRGVPLTSITFEGDVSGLSYGTTPFANCSSLEAVIYESAGAPSGLFSGISSYSEYFTVSFYADKAGLASGTLLSSAAVLKDTALGDITTSTQVATGSVPSLPSGMDTWFGPTDYSQSSALDTSLAMYAGVYDATDLSTAHIVLSADSFAYDGTAKKPSVAVYTYQDVLISSSAYSTQYGRMDEDGETAQTDDRATPGTVYVICTGTGSYSGSVQASYDIYTLQAGSTIEADGIVFMVTQAYNSAPGEVQVGTGVDGELALSASGVTSLCIPAAVYDEYGFEYTVTAVGDYAFGCSSVSGTAYTSLETVEVPDSVERIGDYAFAFCCTGSKASYGGLQSISFGEDSALATIGDHAFYDCSALAALSVPAAVTTIEAYAFFGCNSLATLEFAEDGVLSSIGEGAFALGVPGNIDDDSTSKLTAIDLPPSLTFIGKAAFGCQPALVDLTFSCTRLETISSYAFYNATALTYVAIPQLYGTINQLSEYAFYGCTALETVEFLGDCSFKDVYSQFSPSPFYECSALKTIIYRSKKNTSSYFSSSGSTERVSFYTVSFYASKDDALSSTDMLSSALIQEDTVLSTINTSLTGTNEDTGREYVLEGSIPELPEGMTGWVFEGTLSPDTGLDNSYYAYASDGYDLSDGTIVLDEDTYDLKQDAIVPQESVTSVTGLALTNGVDYELSYTTSEGTMVSSLTSAGDYIACATGIGNYYGSTTCEFVIEEHGCTWERVKGSGRYEHMRAALQLGFENTSCEYAVVVPSGDAVMYAAAVALAGLLDAPLVFTDADELTSQARLELVRSGATSIIVVGSKSLIAETVLDGIEAGVPLAEQVSRISGTDAQGLAEKLYTAGAKVADWSDICVVVSDDDAAAAVSAAALAYAQDAPLFFASDGALSSDTLSAIQQGGFSTVLLAGASSAIGSSVQTTLQASASVARMTDSADFAASADIMAYAFEAGYVALSEVWLASDDDLSLALSAASAAGAHGAALFVVDNYHYGDTLNYLDGQFYELSQGYLLGGTALLSSTIENLVGQIADRSYTDQPSSVAMAVGEKASSGSLVYEKTSASAVSVVGTTSKSLKRATVPKKVKLSDGRSYKVTAIAAGAFRGRARLASVTVRADVASIGANAFKGCKRLATVKVATRKLRSIGAGAFRGCRALKRLSLPSTALRSIGGSCFRGCAKLKSLTLKTAKLKKVGARALKGTAGRLVVRVPKKRVKAYRRLLAKAGLPSKAKVRKG